MKKTIKSFAMVLVLTVLLSCLCVTGITASAAYVTDGNALYEAGDANGDGIVNICDLVAANIGSGSTVAVDLDGNETVDTYDYALIRAIILGIDNSQWTE
ncbi:MAG: hypothetical protein UIG59_02035 [Acutalibacteraceae bacterium]|nr:hypothetical protein [Acutalibacteraceae bacterium]